MRISSFATVAESDEFDGRKRTAYVSRELTG